jgi:hypothetical protein
MGIEILLDFLFRDALSLQALGDVPPQKREQLPPQIV